MEKNSDLIEWLYSNGGPIIRYRTAAELMDDATGIDIHHLYQEVCECSEVQRWLDNLGRAKNIHGSKDTDAENPLAKLLEYGLTANNPAFNEKILPLFVRLPQSYHPITLSPFLIRAGYYQNPFIVDWFKGRLEGMYNAARRGTYDFYLTDEEASKVPKAWCGKPIYKPEYDQEYLLPTCYDFYAMAYSPVDEPQTKEVIEKIIAYLSAPQFQWTVGGYQWDRKKKRCYAAGRVYLACVNLQRLVLFMALGARFASVRDSQWFKEGLEKLEGYRTTRGTYSFPRDLLIEKKNSYYIYGGAHMGLGEDRRMEKALELESTFWMMKIKQLMTV